MKPDFQKNNLSNMEIHIYKPDYLILSFNQVNQVVFIYIYLLLRCSVEKIRFK